MELVKQKFSALTQGKAKLLQELRQEFSAVTHGEAKLFHKTGNSSGQCPTKSDVRILQEEGDEEPAAALTLEDSCHGKLQRHRRPSVELDNSFEALAKDFGDDDYEPHAQSRPTARTIIMIRMPITMARAM